MGNINYRQIRFFIHTPVIIHWCMLNLIIRLVKRTENSIIK